MKTYGQEPPFSMKLSQERDIKKYQKCYWKNEGNIDVYFHCPYLTGKREFCNGTFLPFIPIKCRALDRVKLDDIPFDECAFKSHQ